jgi:predicted permease
MSEAAGPVDRMGRIPSGFRQLAGVIQPAATGISSLRQDFSKPLAVLAAVVAMVLLIACVNLSNFLLARALARQREMSLRLAMGASRGRLLRQMLTENLLLASGGAALGILFAHWSSRLLVALLSSSSRALALDVRLNGSVLLYTSGLVAMTTLLFGLAPAIRALRPRSASLLKETTLQVKGSLGWSRPLLVVQVALSLMLTFGAALFLRTFRNLTSVNPGFDASRVLVAEVQPSRVGIENEQAAQFYRDSATRLARLPGIEAVSSADMTPIQSCCWWDPLEVEGYTPAPGENMDTYFNRVSPDFFRTMGIRVLRGRDFTARDTLTSAPVAIVNDKFANRFFPDGDAIGRFVSLPGGYKSPLMEIVGVVADTAFRDLRSPISYSAYFPMSQSKDIAGSRHLLVRTSGRPELLAAAVRRTVHAFHPAIPVETHALSEEVAGTLTYDRLLALLGAFFGMAALGLAAIGLYGILSYAVTRRTGEIGVRVALGASRWNIVWLAVRQSVTLVLAGMAAGCAGAVALSRYVESLLFGVTPADPGTIGIAALILFLITMLAAWLPARRATAIDPVQALRYE